MNESKKQKNTTKDLRKANLGKDFETLINESNEYYIKNNIAVIYKKPTPIQVVKVQYPKRSRARIIDAYYKVPSTTDYNGVLNGLYIDFEAKSCNGKSFPFGNIYPHQIKHLELINQHNGLSFLLIQFKELNEVYLLLTKQLIEQYNNSLNGGRKSISYEYFKEHGYLVNPSTNPPINYIETILNNKLYLK